MAEHESNTHIVLNNSIVASQRLYVLIIELTLIIYINSLEKFKIQRSVI